MATPVTELHERLRRAELSEAQAAAVAGAFEALDRKIDGVEHRLGERIDGVESRLSERIGAVEHQLEDLGRGVKRASWLAGAVLVAVIGQYIAALFGLTTG